MKSGRCAVFTDSL